MNCLRVRKSVNYSIINDLPRDVIQAIREPRKTISWNQNEPFPIEIVKEVGNHHLEITYVGYSNEYNCVIRKSDLIILESAPSVNGPLSMEDLISVLKFEFTRELKTGNNAVCSKEIRIETTEGVVRQFLTLIGPLQGKIVTVEQLKRHLGAAFNERHINGFGDYYAISQGVITLSVTQPRKEKLFRLIGPYSIEHHILRNNVLPLKFIVETVSGNLDKSFKY